MIYELTIGVVNVGPTLLPMPQTHFDDKTKKEINGSLDNWSYKNTNMSSVTRTANKQDYIY